MGDDDSDIFRRAVDGIRVIPQDRAIPHSERPQAIPKQTQRDERNVLDALLSDEFEAGEIETGDELSYAQPGLQRSAFRKLRRGEYVISAELDLHGHTIPQAREALIEFLAKARHGHATCVRVIHGKGRGSPGRKPVLKHRVFHWLCQRSEVLAVCSARAVDGGSGAAYVLLKKR